VNINSTSVLSGRPGGFRVRGPLCRCQSLAKHRFNWCESKQLRIWSGGIEELHHRWVPAVIIYIYAYLWLFGRHTGGAADTLGVQRRQYNVIYFYSTLSKFAVLLRKITVVRQYIV